MNIGESLGTTGRKMDAAWKAAISAGKKKSRLGSTLYHTTVDGLKHGIVGMAGGAAIGAGLGAAAKKLPVVKQMSAVRNASKSSLVGVGAMGGVMAGKIGGGVTGTATGLVKGLKKDTIVSRAKRATTEAKKAYKNTK